jgi:hypothetical protein
MDVLTKRGKAEECATSSISAPVHIFEVGQHRERLDSTHRTAYDDTLTNSPALHQNPHPLNFTVNRVPSV